MLRLKGSDTRAFLQGTATQDIEQATPGRGTKTLFLTEKGRPVALAWVVIAPDHESAILITDEGAGPGLRPHLERFRIMENVEFEGPEAMPRLFGVAGPERDPLAEAIAASISGAMSVPADPLSFLLLPPATEPEALPSVVDRAVFQAWRLKVGIPLHGVDMDLERIATELALPDAIADKGCYVGQEVVARTTHRGQVRRQRVGFRFDWGGKAFPKGTELHAAGRASGFITSVGREPGAADGLGMGYVTPEAIEQNLDVLAVQGEKTTHLRLRSWPL